MKFYKVLCQFAKTHTLFTESLEKSLDKVVSRGEKNFSVHRKYMNFLRHSKTALDEPLYKLSAGRSMVEMLGVLAIIGVLSVGAIAGYSKAMMKYKLNKQAEQLTTVINAGLRYAGQWNFDSSMVYTIPYLIKLGEIPKEMIKDDSRYIYDVFNTPMYLAYTKTDTEKYTQFFIMLDTSKGDDNSLSICRNIVTIIKEFHQHVMYMYIYSDTSEGGYDSFMIYGDDYCKTNRKCLKDITLTDIDEGCRHNLSKTGNPRIKINWKE